jgi:hypothetical protein
VGTEGSYVYMATVREPIELIATTVKSVSELIACVVAVHNYQTKPTFREVSDLNTMFKYMTTERTYDGYAVRGTQRRSRMVLFCSFLLRRKYLKSTRAKS